ncbi:site-specific DNA-methyltransferase [soil metagenome]
MPELVWIGKDKVVNHHHEVPFHVLDNQYTFNEETGGGNKIIYGDNLTALKSLLPEYEGRVKCIYIDPPYNTGNESWVYNDNVNDAKFKKWLGQVVGKEGEDLSRHDKWLCMMYPRLKLLRRLLGDDGVIFISIDDIEGHYLKVISDEIFGRSNFISNILWQKRTSPDARIHLGGAHDHILVYAKNYMNTKLNKLHLNEEQKESYKNPDNDSRGVWTSTDFTAQGFRPNQMYKITTPSGKVYEPPPGRCWVNVESEFDHLQKDGRMWFGKNGNAKPRVKTFLYETDGISSWTWWTNQEVGHNQESKKEINAILGADNSFDTPKPSRLIERILQIATDKDSIILDSFAGSGTTAHAVLKLNAADNGNRKFILIEQEDYAETITAERVRRVIDGYGEEKKRVEGLGGAFDFYTIGAPLFLEDGNLNEEIGIDEIRRYVAYTENISEPSAIENEHSPYLLGFSDDTAYFFYYEKERVTYLNIEFLAALKFRPAESVIYADTCLLEKEELKRYNITFKKIPRDITRF